MPLFFIRNDLVQMDVDAIVNAANETLLGGGGVDGAIRRAAGEELLAECRTLGECRTGEAKITKGYRLKAKYIIHTVGPVWQGGDRGEDELLSSCYTESLRLAAQKGLSSVAFPLISTGACGYPAERAISLAVGAISEFLFKDEMTVYLVFFGTDLSNVAKKVFSGLKEYIDDRYADARLEENEAANRRRLAAKTALCDALLRDSSDSFGSAQSCRFLTSEAKTGSAPGKTAHRKNAAGKNEMKVPSEPFFEEDRPESLPCPPSALSECEGALSLEERIANADESFSRTVLRLIDERGMTDAECYKRANIDRKLFSKIRSQKDYRPSKPTAVALAVALRLTLGETEALLRKAGYALSHAQKFDIIIEYFIENGNYDIFEINEALFSFDQVLLGA